LSNRKAVAPRLLLAAPRLLGKSLLSHRHLGSAHQVRPRSGQLFRLQERRSI
jgi:hypothetical protein